MEQGLVEKNFSVELLEDIDVPDLRNLAEFVQGGGALSSSGEATIRFLKNCLANAPVPALDVKEKGADETENLLTVSEQLRRCEMLRATADFRATTRTPGVKPRRTLTVNSSSIASLSYDEDYSHEPIPGSTVTFRLKRRLPGIQNKILEVLVMGEGRN